jgi:hypothetical protein
MTHFAFKIGTTSANDIVELCAIAVVGNNAAARM